MSRDDLLRVTRIRVEKLFGKYTHDVPLRTKDRVTIIHGPNGVGKTVLFRLVTALLSGNFIQLLKVPFKKFEVTLSDNTTLGFSRIESRKKGDDALATCYLSKDDAILHSSAIGANEIDTRRLASRIERTMPWVSQIDEDRFLDRRTDEIFTTAELPNYYRRHFPGKSKQSDLLFAKDEWMLSIRERVNVHLVEAQRLLRLSERQRDWEPPHIRQRDHFVETVKSYAKDLQSRISETLTLYAKQSQSMDQSFPQRLLKNMHRPLSVDELKTRMNELEDNRKQLKRLGLVAEDSAYPFDVRELEKLDATQGTVMTLYVEDTGKKLSVLDDLAKRIEILIENINKKFAHKYVLIDREKGLIARTDDGQLLELDALSSGEQHELVLLYDLLFRVKPNTLVLVDEPELSLHVTWQKSFLPDLIKVVETTGYDVVLATHSPFIVGDRDDLMVSLSVEDSDTSPASKS